MKNKRFLVLGVALVLFALVANFVFAQNVTVTFENRSSHWVNVAWGPDYKPQLLAAGGSRSFSIPIGTNWSHDNNHLVRYVANEDNTKITFYNR